jgi:hypothetical protein
MYVVAGWACLASAESYLSLLPRPVYSPLYCNVALQLKAQATLTRHYEFANDAVGILRLHSYLLVS